MRVLFFCRSKRRTQTTEHIASGFRQAGHEVKIVHQSRWRRVLGRRIACSALAVVAKRFRPDFILIWKSTIFPELLADLARSYKTVLWCVDYFDPPPEKLIECARLVELFLLTNKGQLPLYRQLGVKRVEFVAQGCSDDKHQPISSAPAKFGSDVAFIGQPGNQRRQELLFRLDEGFDMKMWGPHWDDASRSYKGAQYRDVRPKDYARICAASKIMLGCDHTRDVELCFSNRTWLTLGCGGFLVTNYYPGLETLFKNHEHLVWYHSVEECMELLRHYLDRAEEREQIARAGCELVHQSHTYRQRALEIATMVKELPDKP